jgi:hypothetical protein
MSELIYATIMVCEFYWHINNATFDRHWAAYWDFRIPYLLHPMSTTWALSVWPAVYGIYRSNVTVDLKADVIISGRDAGWYASRGCGEYSNISVSGGPGLKPYIYITYGSRVLNALHQTQRRVGPVLMSTQVWARGFGGASIGPQLSANDAFEPRDFIQAISTFTPGSIRTYDWETDTVLSPVVECGNFLPQHWIRLREHAYAKLEAAGVISAHVDQIVGHQLGTFDVLSFFDNTDGQQAAGNEAIPEN